MNKTVNINLAGTFFHIDEDAYGKLQRYLDAIRRSLSDPQGSDEIIKDIEARIAELFSEKLERQTQVVTIKELDEVIAVMGQPEDYAVDEEIFEDQPRSSHQSRSGHKQLFRDVDNKYIAGVSSGLGHYLGIDAIWIRLLWVLLTFFSGGTFILVYALFWILVPPALSTSEKLKMTGEPINISNIEKKFKEGYESVAEKVKNVDVDKYGQKVKSGASGFFETLGSILRTLFNIFVKFLGILVIIVSLSTLIGLIVGLVTAGSVGFWGPVEFSNWYYIVDTTNAPLWLVSLLALFAVGIPFFVLFILGLKMLVPNLKSIGLPTKITLFIVWLAAVIGLGILGLRQATETAYEADFNTENVLAVRPGDTLNIKMVSNELYEYDTHRGNRPDIKYNEQDQRIIYSNDVRLIVRSTADSVGKIVIRKTAEGNTYLNAKEKAEAIDYTYQYDGKTLGLDGYLTTPFEQKYRDQEVTVFVYLPEGTILFAANNTYSFHRNDYHYRDILNNGDEEEYLLIRNGETHCLSCPGSNDTQWDENSEIEEPDQNRDWRDKLNNDLKEETPTDTLNTIQIDSSNI